jgi:type I restriction enzyme, S subunit
MNADTLLENFEILAEAPGGIDRLRELVIALAVSGQIVKMRMPDDDTVDELLRCAAGEVDPYPEMSKKRFDVPLHWTWVPLASIARHQLGKMLNTGKMKGERVKYLRSVNVRQDGRIDLSDVKEMLIPIDELEKYSVKSDDIFVNEGGDVGRNAIWLIESEERFAFQNQLHRLRPICGISSRYLQLVFRDAKSRGVIAELSSGVTIQHFSASSIRKLAIPLPPLAEQKHIVAKVDELMALCDQLEQQQKQRDNLRTATRKSAIDAISTATTPEELEATWKRINNNWDVIADTPESIDHLRSLVINLGVQGQLFSPQEIGTDGYPISWKTRKFGGYCDIEGGSQPPKDYFINELKPDYVRLFQIRDLGTNPVPVFIPRTMAKSFSVVGDILIGRYGASVGKIFRAQDGAYNVALVKFVFPKDDLMADFVFWMLQSSRIQAIFSGMSRSAQAGFNKRDLAGLDIPIPEMKEQKQIVAKIDELMALCDQLEARLKVRSEVAEKFARSVVNAA